MTYLLQCNIFTLQNDEMHCIIRNHNPLHVNALKCDAILLILYLSLYYYNIHTLYIKAHCPMWQCTVDFLWQCMPFLAMQYYDIVTMCSAQYTIQWTTNSAAKCTAECADLDWRFDICAVVGGGVTSTLQPNLLSSASSSFFSRF